MRDRERRLMLLSDGLLAAEDEKGLREITPVPVTSGLASIVQDSLVAISAVTPGPLSLLDESSNDYKRISMRDSNRNRQSMRVS